MSVNKVSLIGRLGKDPEVRAMENGRKVARFPVATDDSYKDREGNKVERTDWHNVVFWGPQAEICERFLNKGKLVYIEGKLKTRSYEQDGVTKYATEVLGVQMTMLGSRNDDGGQNGGQMGGGMAAAPAQTTAATAATPVSNAAPAMEDVDDLPF